MVPLMFVGNLMTLPDLMEDEFNPDLLDIIRQQAIAETMAVTRYVTSAQVPWETYAPLHALCMEIIKGFPSSISEMASYCSYSWTDVLDGKSHPRHSCTVNAYHRSLHICSCRATR